MSSGKSVRLFLSEGTPGGLLTAEIMNWTGHVVAAPRSDLATLLKRPETSRTGVYILLGDDPGSVGGQLAYIGEGDDISRRLYQHSRSEDRNGKDFWDRAIVLTSKDANLTKAHARYLESRFIALADKAKRAQIVNGTAPAPIALPEADVSDMEYFIEQAKIVLPVLGVNLFRSPTATPTTSQASAVNDATDSPVFEMRLDNGRLSATAHQIDGEFTVLEGSLARRTWGGAQASYTKLREKLEQDGTLAPTPDDTAMRFTRDHVFASPSAAAAVVAGRSANGRVLWLVQGEKRTFGQWEAEGVEEAMQQKRAW